MSHFTNQKLKNLEVKIIGKKIIVLEEVESTNDEIKKHLKENEGLVIVSNSQTQGRGRLGRNWHSPKGTGVYFSALVNPKIEPELFPPITLAAGLATILALQKFSKSPPYLKWPNDILINEKKVSGILCELCENDPFSVIIGIGINVNQEIEHFSEPLKKTATSLLLENGTEVDREELIISLITSLDKVYGDFLENGPQAITEQWARHTDLFGKKITLVRGGIVYTGTALRLTEEGKLEIISSEGESLLFDSGEVAHIG
jgi:BirA family transcriptional regulator, biotin operon repressor / biotin---[acetyl-CoA-carboxylase] ligase